MSAGIWFWLIYVLAAIAIACGWYWSWPVFSVVLVIFILLGLLGFKVFGRPVQ
jgi:hypothetical protein